MRFLKANSTKIIELSEKNTKCTGFDIGLHARAHEVCTVESYVLIS